MKSPRSLASRRRLSLAFPCLIGLSAAAFTPAIGHAQTIFIDFGGGGSSETAIAGWNNITGVGTMASAASLLDVGTATASGITYQITDAFLATNGQGSSIAVGEFPLTATRDSFYGDNTNATASITFAGFDPAKEYTFTFFASRAGASDDRSALYSITGASTDSTALNPSSNESLVASVISVTPSVSGTFVLDVSKHPTLNVNSSGFYYLGAMKIEAVSAVPEPSSFASLAAGASLVAAVGLRRRRSSSV